MTVAHKDLLDLQPSYAQRPLIERDPDLEMEIVPGNHHGGRKFSGGRPACLLSDSPPDVGVRRLPGSPRPAGETRLIPDSQAKPISMASAVFIPFRWTELVAQVNQVAWESDILPGRRIARFKDVCVDFSRMEVRRSSGEPITTYRPGVQDAQMLPVKSGQSIFAQ